MKKMIFPKSLSQSLRFNAAVLLVSAGLSFTCGVTAVSAQDQATGNPPAGTAQVTLDLRDVDIRVLIDTVAEVSGKNFIVDPRVKGKVNVVSGASLTPERLYDAFLAVLEVHNFATVESGDMIKILPSNVIKQRPTPTLFSPTEDTNDTQITQIIQLTHASVQELVPIIRPLIPPTSHFAPHTPSNSVVLTDTAANIQRVLQIIRRIDVPDERSNTHVVYLDKSKASDIANTLTQLVTASKDPKSAGTAPKISIQPLDAINALVINATDGEYAKLQALINELDIERVLQSDINVIYLKHAKAEDMVAILNDVTAVKTDGAVSDFSVQADESTNSLIVKASGGQLSAVQGVIDKLDLRRPQVFVETVIAEVSLDQEANLGIEWGAGGARNLRGGAAADDGAGTPTTPATSVTGTIGNLVDENDPNTPIGTASLGFNGTGLNFSLLDFKKYQLNVIINALRADSNSNILSTPNILTLDNETAEIVVGQEVPFITGSFNNGFNNSTTQDAQGNPVSNTAGSSFQTIERKDVGIKLKIKPQINDGDTIILEVLQEISSVSDTTVQGQADLITNRRSIEAVVQVDDGQVIALGGLIQDDVMDTVSRVPVLGSLPIVGALFRNKSKMAIKRNLMIFLKPRIIRNPEDLAKYSKQKYDEVRRDGEVSRLNSDKYLIDDADPPVLDEYENVVDEGVLGTERRREELDDAAAGKPPAKGVRRMINKQVDRLRDTFGKDSEVPSDKQKQELAPNPQAELKENDDDINVQPEAQSKDYIEGSEDDPNRIDWGDDSPPPPAAVDDN